MDNSTPCGLISSSCTIDQFGALNQTRTFPGGINGVLTTSDNATVYRALTQNVTSSNDPSTVYPTNVTTDGYRIGTGNITDVLLTAGFVSFEERIIEGTLVSLICVVGIPANFLLFMTLVYNKRFRKPLHVMLCSIFLFDFFTVSVTPLHAYAILKDKWDIGKMLCNIHALVNSNGICLTLMTHGLVAANCYFRTKFMSNLARTLSGFRAVIIGISINVLLVGLVNVLPHATGYVSADYAYVIGTCISAWTADVAQNIETQVLLIFTVSSVIPLTVCGFSYSKVLFIIVKRRVVFENEVMKRQFVKGCKRMGALFIAFNICYLPFTIITFVDPLFIIPPVWTVRIFYILLQSHVVVNPLVCFITMSDINQGLRDMLAGNSRMKGVNDQSVSSRRYNSKQQSSLPKTVSHSNSDVSSDRGSGKDSNVNSWM